ncbi:MAG: tetratricopeptide repeat protein [Defluviitaleaceae bacterium]|nr:tetratricopeptide repeat protein [Defluviitaleaceae bacterium]
MLKERKFVLAREALDSLKPSIETSSKEVQYHFRHSLGILLINEGKSEEGLYSLVLADDLEAQGFDKEPILSYNLAISLSRLGKYAASAGVLERAYREFSQDKMDVTSMMVDSNLGLNYLRLGHFELAKMFFEKSLARANYLNHTRYIGNTLHNLGCLYLKTRKHDKAIEYFNKASGCFKRGSDSYLEVLYFKSLCYIELKNTMREASVSRGRSLSKDNDHYSLLFESLSHLMYTKKDESLDYIENQTIPYLLGKHQYFKLFDYYLALENAYAKKGTKDGKIQSLEIKAKAFDIHKIMTSGREFL